MRVEKKQGRLRRWVARRIFPRRQKFSPLLEPEENHLDDDEGYSSEEGEHSDKCALSTLKSKDTATATRSHTSQDDSSYYSTSRKDTEEQRRVRSDLSGELAIQRQRRHVPLDPSTSIRQRYPNTDVPSVLHCDQQAESSGQKNYKSHSFSEDVLSTEDVTIEFAEADSDSQQNHQGTEVLLFALKESSAYDNCNSCNSSMHSGNGRMANVWDTHHRNDGHQKGGLFLSFSELGLESVNSHDAIAKTLPTEQVQGAATFIDHNNSSSAGSRKPVLHHQLSASSMSLVESNKTADRSASSVTWVSHEDDFDNTDMRPLREITLEYSPTTEKFAKQNSSSKLRSTSDFIRRPSEVDKVELVNALIFGKPPMTLAGRNDVPTTRSSSLNRPRESDMNGDSASNSKRRIRSYDDASARRGRVIPIINRATGAESFDDEIEQINRKIIEPPSLKAPSFHDETLSPLEPYKNKNDLSRRENTILEETLSLTDEDDEDEDEHFKTNKQKVEAWRPMPSVKIVIPKEKKYSGRRKKVDSFDQSTSVDEQSENSSRLPSSERRKYSSWNRRDRRSRGGGRAESSIESSFDEEYDDEYDDEDDDDGVGLECGFLDDVVAMDDDFSVSRATQSYATTTAGQSNATPSVATSQSEGRSGRASSPVYEKRRGPSSGKSHPAGNTSSAAVGAPNRTSSRALQDPLQRRSSKSHIDSTTKGDRRHRRKERRSNKKSFLESIEDVARDSTCMVMDFFHSRR